MSFEENKLYRGNAIAKNSKYPDYLLAELYVRLELENGKTITEQQAESLYTDVFKNVCNDLKTDLIMFRHPGIVEYTWLSTSNVPIPGKKVYMVARIKTDKGKLIGNLYDEFRHNKKFNDPYYFLAGGVTVINRFADHIEDEFKENVFKCILDEPVLKIKPETKNIFGGMLDEL
jgi:hypothetical protein